MFKRTADEFGVHTRKLAPPSPSRFAPIPVFGALGALVVVKLTAILRFSRPLNARRVVYFGLAGTRRRERQPVIGRSDGCGRPTSPFHLPAVLARPPCRGARRRP